MSILVSVSIKISQKTGGIEKLKFQNYEVKMKNLKYPGSKTVTN
jgi:hypothetical protein